MPPKKRKTAGTKPIVFIITPKHKAQLQAKGLLTNRRATWARVRYVNGRLLITRHLARGKQLVAKKGQFVASNSAFA
jgi:hypothetical protein